MIWCSFDSFEHGKPHLVLILQPACWSELPCFIGNLVHISPAQSSLTSDSSHVARAYIQQTLQCHSLWTRMLLAKMTVVKMFNSVGCVCVSLLFSHWWFHIRGRGNCLIIELWRAVWLWFLSQTHTVVLAWQHDYMFYRGCVVQEDCFLLYVLMHRYRTFCVGHKVGTFASGDQIL